MGRPQHFQSAPARHPPSIFQPAPASPLPALPACLPVPAEDATAEEYMDFYLDDETRMKWDAMITGGWVGAGGGGGGGGGGPGWEGVCFDTQNNGVCPACASLGAELCAESSTTKVSLLQLVSHRSSDPLPPFPPAPRCLPLLQRRSCWRPAPTPPLAARSCAGCAPSPLPSSLSGSTSSPAASSGMRTAACMPAPAGWWTTPPRRPGCPAACAWRDTTGGWLGG